MKDEEFEGLTNNEYDVLVRDSITTLYQDRLRALAQNRVLAKKYNEILKINKDLHETILELHEKLHHAEKERDQLKRKTNAEKGS